MKIKVVLTGATGMVGEGVLHECLQSDDIELVLALSRRPCGIAHPKLREVIHDNFYNLAAVEKHLIGYDACFFCLGTTSVGKPEAIYRKITYDLTMNVAKTLSRLNKAMVFCYISGEGTDSSESGRIMWARIKGRTENDLMHLPFRSVYNFRPGYIHPTPGLKHTLPFYKYLTWLYPIIHFFFRNHVCTQQQLGQAMIKAATKGYEKPILEVNDIVALSAK